jgi:hypothetical protein
MNRYPRNAWLAFSVFFFVALLALALGSPSPAVGQEQTPTLVPPPPRTVPPGLRTTPTPVPPTVVPGNPESPVPTLIAALPVTGGSTPRTDQIFYLFLMLSGLGLFATGLGLRLARHSRAK